MKVEKQKKLAQLAVLDRRNFLLLSSGLLLPSCSHKPKRLTLAPSCSISDYDAIGLSDLIRKRKVSPLELVDRSIKHIELLEPKLNALTTSVFEQARMHAQMQAQSKHSGGPLAGVPFMFKDLIDVAGISRSDGANKAFSRVPLRSSSYMQAVKSSGLNFLAATNTPEFANSVNTNNIRFGVTSNPWELNLSVAGSSGGSAAAVAAGYVPMAHGTDGSGSLRLPASYCGLFGFKPSRARTLSAELNGQHDYIKHNHVISRSVRDSALMLSITEDRSKTALYTPIGNIKNASNKRLRIAVDTGGMYQLSLDPEQQHALESALELLSDLGHHIEKAPVFPVSAEEYWLHMENIFLSRMPALIKMVENITQKPFSENQLLSPLTTTMALRSKTLGRNALQNATRFFEQLTIKLTEQFQGTDIVVSPVQAIVHPKLDSFSPLSDYADIAHSMREFMSFTAIANATGAPAMSVPLYWSKTGMPLGTHFQALPGQDKQLLELAYELEIARPWKDRWAPHSIKNLELRRNTSC